MPSKISGGPLAQLVEQRTFNPWVVGSSPTGPTGSPRGALAAGDQYRTIPSPKLERRPPATYPVDS